MGFNVIFNENGYKDAIKSGKCHPPNVFTPFINVDWAKYDDLRRKTSPLNVDKLQCRLSTKMFSNIRGAMGFTLRYARNFFPAYRFFVNEYLNDEWLATVDWHKFHRDHVIHQPMTVYVGLSLLKGVDLSGQCTDPLLFGNKRLLDYCLEAIHYSPKCTYLKEYLRQMGGSKIYLEDSPASKVLWESLFLDTFFLATLFHDMGYPWQFVNVINKKLIHHSPLENPSIQDAEWIADNYGDRLFFYPINGYKKPDPTAPSHWDDKKIRILSQGLCQTHGISGALTLLYLNDALRIYPNMNLDRPERRFCVEWAAMAVMMHDMTKIYSTKVEPKKARYRFEHDIQNPHMRLSINRDPLSFMLTLTDQIQDFARPDSTFKSSNPDQSIATYYSKCKSVSLEFDHTKTLKIKYTYENPGIYIQNRQEFLPENEVKFFDPHNGYLDYKDLGISQVKMLAELDIN